MKNFPPKKGRKKNKLQNMHKKRTTKTKKSTRTQKKAHSAGLWRNKARAVGQFRMQPYFLIAKVSLLYFRIITSLPGSKPLAPANEVVVGRREEERALAVSFSPSRGALLLLLLLRLSRVGEVHHPIIIFAGRQCMRGEPPKKRAEKKTTKPPSFCDCFRRESERGIFVFHP